jgi:hypothetical protein
VSTPKRIILSLQLQANAIACNGVATPFKHHRAALFLEGLIAASSQTRAYTKAEFLAAWAAQDPLAAPDRKAISRVVGAVREALGAALPGGAERLEVAARGLTTGPWRLRTLPQEVWQVQGQLPAPGADAEPAFTATADPLAWCHAASGLATADALLKEGQYQDCAGLLQAQMQMQGKTQTHKHSYALSDAGWCMWMLRLVRVQRRLGLDSPGQEGQRLLQQRAAQLPWRMRAYVQSKMALLSARAGFDAQPLRASLHGNFDEVRAVVDTAPNVNLQWEWCNLRSLTYRRQIEQRLQGKAPPHVVQALVAEALQTFGAAYFWSCVAKDSYHGQAIACNFAYTLHWLHKKGLYDGLAAALAWFKLAHTLVDRFDLPQDSAWDFLMLGDIYLGSAQARALIDADVLAWPEQSNPAQEAFYLRALELARTYGNARQQIMALNQQAGFLQQQGLGQQGTPGRRQKVRKERDALMALHPVTMDDMVKDGLELY